MMSYPSTRLVWRSTCLSDSNSSRSLLKSHQSLLKRLSSSPIIVPLHSLVRHSSSGNRILPPNPSESYLIGPQDPPLLEHSLPFHWSERILPVYHHHPALVSRAEPPSQIHQTDRRDCLQLSYAQLDHSINSMALALHHLGIRKGDRVGINTSNHSIYPILQWATSKIGAILATINPSYGPAEVINVIKRVDCKVLFSMPSFKSKDMVPMLSTLLEESPSLTHLVIVDSESHLAGKRSKSEIFQKFDSHQSAVLDLDDLSNAFTSASPQLPQAEIHANEVINLQFTSGTTGFPKAVSLTHRNLLNNACHIADRLNLTAKDSVCNVPPMFHCFGSVIGNLAGFVRGAKVVIPSPTFDPSAVIQTVSQERCTVLHGVGTMFLAEINELDRMPDADVSSLRTGVVAGSPVPEELMSLIEKRLGIQELSILYGMTETSPGSFQTRASDERSKRTTTVGTIYPHTRAKVVDLKTSEIVKRGQRGELLVSGYSVQKGYWNDQLETDKAMIKDEEGRVWMKTGDIASIDSEGFLKIVGRAKEVIIRGGENLFPVVIENCIIKLEGVENVAVVGVKDDFYGEVVGAFVKRHPPIQGKSGISGHSSRSDLSSTTQEGWVTEDEIRAAIKSQISGANVPKHIWFLDRIGKDDFPMTASGKIKKTELTAWVNDLMSSN